MISTKRPNESTYSKDDVAEEPSTAQSSPFVASLCAIKQTLRPVTTRLPHRPALVGFSRPPIFSLKHEQLPIEEANFDQLPPNSYIHVFHEQEQALVSKADATCVSNFKLLRCDLCLRAFTTLSALQFHFYGQFHQHQRWQHKWHWANGTEEAPFPSPSSEDKEATRCQLLPIEGDSDLQRLSERSELFSASAGFRDQGPKILCPSGLGDQFRGDLPCITGGDTRIVSPPIWSCSSSGASLTTVVSQAANVHQGSREFKTARKNKNKLNSNTNNTSVFPEDSSSPFPPLSLPSDPLSDPFVFNSATDSSLVATSFFDSPSIPLSPTAADTSSEQQHDVAESIQGPQPSILVAGLVSATSAASTSPVAVNAPSSPSLLSPATPLRRVRSSPSLSLLSICPVSGPVSSFSAPPSPHKPTARHLLRSQQPINSTQGPHPRFSAGDVVDLSASASLSPCCPTESKRGSLLSHPPSSSSCTYVLPASGPLLPTPLFTLRQLRSSGCFPPRTSQRAQPVFPTANASHGEDALSPPAKMSDAVLSSPHVWCQVAAPAHTNEPPATPPTASRSLNWSPPATGSRPSSPVRSPLNRNAAPFSPSVVDLISSSVLSCVLQSLLLAHSSLVVTPSSSSLVVTSPDRKSVRIVLPVL